MDVFNRQLSGWTVEVLDPSMDPRIPGYLGMNNRDFCSRQLAEVFCFLTKYLLALCGVLPSWDEKNRFFLPECPLKPCLSSFLPTYGVH